MSNTQGADGARQSNLPRWILACVLLLLPMTATAQVMLRPADKPLVTAENELWYLAAEPLTFSGTFYYPAGPRVFFNPNEMVRSGSYRGIPLFTLATREPYGVLYVPVGGGLMQPYERRRSGEVAGTVGTSAPSFPVQRDLEPEARDYPLQAQGPPALREWVPPAEADVVSNMGGYPRGAEGSDWREPRGPLVTARMPAGLNAFYIEHQGQRWFAAGKAVVLDPAAFTRAGDYRGFPVYVARSGQPGLIFVSVAGASEGGLATPYSSSR
jgi:hypothetical protein